MPVAVVGGAAVEDAEHAGGGEDVHELVGIERDVKPPWDEPLREARAVEHPARGAKELDRKVEAVGGGASAAAAPM